MTFPAVAEQNPLLPASYDVAWSAVLVLFLFVPLVGAFVIGAWWGRRHPRRQPGDGWSSDRARTDT